MGLRGGLMVHKMQMIDLDVVIYKCIDDSNLL